MRGTNRPPSSAIKEALLLIASRKLSPTPLNIALIHQELEGRAPEGLILAADLAARFARHGAAVEHASTMDAALAEALFQQLTHEAQSWRALLVQGAAPALDALAQPWPDLSKSLAELVEKPSSPLEEWAALSRVARNRTSSQQALGQALHDLLKSIGATLPSFSGDEGEGAAPAELLERLSGPDALTPMAVRETEEALLALARSRSKAQQALRQRKKLLQQALLDALRGISESSAGLDAQSHRVGSLAQDALDASSDPLIRQALGPLAREAKTLAESMRAASARLRQGEEAVASAQAEVQALRQDLARAARQAREDSLTGALNRRGLDEAAAPLLHRAAGGEPLVAALLDLDDFRAVNDALGHDGGDQALMHLSTTLTATLRPQDVVARFGGEEFVILLPGLSLADGKEALAKAQRALTKDLWIHGRQKLLTFSSGATAWREGDDLAKMLSRADFLMYQAKKNGKNRVFVDGDA
jgi:diguanylate cyclase